MPRIRRVEQTEIRVVVTDGPEVNRRGWVIRWSPAHGWVDMDEVEIPEARRIVMIPRRWLREEIDAEPVRR